MKWRVMLAVGTALAWNPALWAQDPVDFGGFVHEPIGEAALSVSDSASCPSLGVVGGDPFTPFGIRVQMERAVSWAATLEDLELDSFDVSMTLIARAAARDAKGDPILSVIVSAIGAQSEGEFLRIGQPGVQSDIIQQRVAVFNQGALILDRTGDPVPDIDITIQQHPGGVRVAYGPDPGGPDPQTGGYIDRWVIGSVDGPTVIMVDGVAYIGDEIWVRWITEEPPLQVDHLESIDIQAVNAPGFTIVDASVDAGVFFDGLSHTPRPGAALQKEGGVITLSPADAEAFGVDIDTSRAVAWRGDLDFADGAQGQATVVARGTVGGAGGRFLGALELELAGDSIGVAANFAGGDALGSEIVVFNGEDALIRRQGDPVPSIDITIQQHPAGVRVAYQAAGTGGGGFLLTGDETFAVEVDGQIFQTTALALRKVLAPGADAIRELAEISVTAEGVSFFTLAEESVSPGVVAFGWSHRAVGAASLTRLDGAPSELRIANLGSGGGVAVQLDDARFFETSWRAEPEGLSSEGSLIQVSLSGSVDGGPTQSLGTARMSRAGVGYALSGDNAALGQDAVSYRIYRNNRVVASGEMGVEDAIVMERAFNGSGYRHKKWTAWYDSVPGTLQKVTPPSGESVDADEVWIGASSFGGALAVDELTLTASGVAALDLQLQAARNGPVRLVYPWVSNRANQFESVVLAHNFSQVDQQVTLTARRGSGEAQTITRTIPASGFLEEDAGSLFDVLGSGAGYTVVLEANDARVSGGWVTNNLETSSGASPSQGVAAPVPDGSGAASERAGRAVLFSHLPVTGGFISAPVVVNVGDAPTDITLLLFDTAGRLAASQILEGAVPFQPFAAVANSLLPQGSGNVYMIAASPNQPVTGASFVFNQQFREPAIGNATAIDFDAGSVAPPADLRAWFPFDERGGTIAFELVNGANGAYVNAPVPVAGEIGAGLSFGASENGAVAADAAALDFGTGDFTLETWIRADQGPGVATFLDKRESGPFRGYSFFLVNGALGVQLADGVGGGFTNYTSQTQVADGAWRHLAVVVDRDDAAGLRVYLDGQLTDSLNPTGRSGSLDSGADLSIGLHSFGSAGFNGALDELKLYGRALTEAEIQGIYHLAKLR